MTEEEQVRAPLLLAWARALAVLHTPDNGLAPVDLLAADEAVRAASRTLVAMDPERGSWVSDTVDALTALTDDWIRQQDPHSLLVWLLSQDSQLRARLDSWRRARGPGE